MALSILALNCTLKSTGDSSTDLLLNQALAAFKKYDATGTIVRVAAQNILPGVSSQAEGPGDAWPALRQQILDADILLFGTPIWMGQPSSVAKRILERLDGLLDEIGDDGRMPSYGKVAAVVIVGNEDGAHHTSAAIFQSLNDTGFTIPASGVTYWVGEAMGDVDYKDLKETPKKVAEATATLARNTAHLATLLKAHAYPAKQAAPKAA